MGVGDCGGFWDWFWEVLAVGAVVVRVMVIDEEEEGRENKLIS